MLEIRICQAHRKLFFYDSSSRKGGGVSRPIVFGVGRRVGGREGKAETLGFPRDLRFVWVGVRLCGWMWHLWYTGSAEYIFALMYNEAK